MSKLKIFSKEHKLGIIIAIAVVVISLVVVDIISAVGNATGTPDLTTAVLNWSKNYQLMLFLVLL